MQQGIKFSVFQGVMQVRITFSTGFLVENDKLDTVQVANQLCFNLADYPGDFNAGHLFLKAQYHGNDMGDVANGGQAQYTDGVNQVTVRFQSFTAGCGAGRGSLVN